MELEDKRLNYLKLQQCNSFPVFLNCLDADLISISHESHHQVKNRRFKYEMLLGGKIVGFYLHPQNDYFETGYFVFVVSFPISSVELYFHKQEWRTPFF